MVVTFLGLCLSLYDLHALNRDVNMIQTNKTKIDSIGSDQLITVDNLGKDRYQSVYLNKICANANVFHSMTVVVWCFRRVELFFILSMKFGAER